MGIEKSEMLICCVALIDATTSTAKIYGYSVLLGIGSGCGMQAAFSVVQSVVRPELLSFGISFIMIGKVSQADHGMVQSPNSADFFQRSCSVFHLRFRSLAQSSSIQRSTIFRLLWSATQELNFRLHYWVKVATCCPRWILPPAR